MTSTVVPADDDLVERADPNELDLAIVERVLNAAVGLGMGQDWNNGVHAKQYGYRKQLLDALPAALEAMARLQDRASLSSELARCRNALEAIGSQAICYGMRADETELRDWLKFISETAEAALNPIGERE